MLTLRPYQDESLTAISGAVARGITRQLVSLPTGTGKTVLFAELIRRRSSGRALIIVHREELLAQAVEKLRVIAPHLSVGIIKAELDERDADVVIASVQTLSRSSRLHRINRDFTTIVVDEAHHATADTYRRILEHLGVFSPDGPLLLGVTATPYRADNATLVDDIFEELVYERGLLEMIREGYLSDLRATQVQLAVDFNALHVRSGDFATDEVENMLVEANAPDHVADAFLQHAKDRRALLFAPTVKLAKDMASALIARGITAEVIDGTTPSDLRKTVLARLRSGATQVVSNCGVLTEGFDEPSVSCIVVARPTRSKTLFVQMIGRGTRKYPAKEDCLILDVVGATSRHDLMTTETLFEVSTKHFRNRRVTEAVVLEDLQRQTQRDAELLAGRLVAQTVTLFEKRDLRWLNVSPGHFILSAGESGMLHLRQSGLTWNIHLASRDGSRRSLGSGLTLEYAQGVAEDYARQSGASALLHRDADWRQAPASEKQLGVLRRMRMRPAPGLTRGEASDLISKRVATRGNFRRKN